MRLRLRALIYASVAFTIIASLVIWQSDPRMVQRGMYPAKARLVAWSTHCDAGTPDWLHSLAAQLAIWHDSPANQIAFVTPAGDIKACVNGWQGVPLLSPRVTQDTPMRLASLSKIVSFAALLGPEGTARDTWLASPLMRSLKLTAPHDDPRLDQIHIQHLLNHSAGFDRHKSGDPISTMGKTPWCPHDLARIEELMLDYTPGARQSYHNLDYCLAAVAYERYFGHSLWQKLEDDWRMADYGLDYLERRDSPVQYNFMRQDALLGSATTGPEFVNHLDWQAARAPMGLTGNARGLAAFIHAHRDRLQFALSMRDDSISCDETRVDSCFDGFLNRWRVDGTRLWRQRGYLYGMSAHFVLDESGNYIVWLGAGEGQPLQGASNRIDRALLHATDTGTKGEHADASRSNTP